MSAKKLNWRQAHWSLFLACFDFVLHHHPGKSMGKSDALSRRADDGTGSDDNSNMVLLSPSHLAVRALEGLELTGEEQNIMRDVWKGVKDGDKEEAVEKAAKDLQNSPTRSVRSAE